MAESKNTKAGPAVAGARNPEAGETEPVMASKLEALLVQNSGWHVLRQNPTVTPQEPEKVMWHVEVLEPDPRH